VLRTYSKTENCGLTNSGSKITLFIATLVVGVITSNFVPYQQSLAQAQDNSTNSMSMSMMPDSTLSPENVTASIGDLILTTFGTSAGLRIPEPGKPLMEVSWVGGGSFRGTINVSDFGTVWVEFGTDGVSRSHGQGMIMNEKGEVATYTVQAIGTMGKDGYLRNHGTVFFNASSGGDFALLSKTVGVFADQINQKGNAVTKIWELK
jgi:hypothetical protein